MRFGSVCSGIEAATVAWHPLGCEAAWYTEVERFCCDLLKHYYPTTPNLGDITTLEARQIDGLGPIDVLVGGTPCQSFSVAGLRKGMADPRGNLALRYLQLAGLTGARWLLWENVPGVLSSNKGRDFAAFLGGMEELGYWWAYRILDAQYFGVPQRRRRVFVVGYLGDWRGAAAVLFERACLCGHPPPSREAGARVAHSLARGACGSHGRYDPNGEDYIATTLRGRDGSKGVDSDVTDTLVFDTTQVTSPGNYSEPKSGDACHPLAKGQHPPSVCIPLDMRNAGRDPEKHDQQNRQGVGVGENGAPAPMVDSAHVDAVAYRTSGNSGVMEQGDKIAALQTNTDPTQQIITQVGVAVRRLTPRECERLQGFPDDYTKIPYRGKPADKCPDGPRYRALGNSMAVPVMQWIGERILEAERR